MPNKLKISLLLIAAAVLAASIPMFAHHGTNISYDHSKPITLKGSVTEFRFNNPHAQIFFDVKDERGNVVQWGGELTSPYNLSQGGWTKRLWSSNVPAPLGQPHLPHTDNRLKEFR